MKDLEKQVIEVMAGGEEQDPLILGRINTVSIAQHCYLRKKHSPASCHASMPLTE
jgi:hypothetical protein